MILLFCALLAASDIHKPVKVTCPVDGTKFDAIEITATNQWGGRDADGCAHAYNTTPMESYVWVCPTCKFAGRKKEFDATLPDAAKQAQIPGHVKYDLLAQVAQIRKAAPEEIGRAWLHASWSCRQQGVTYLSD